MATLYENEMAAMAEREKRQENIDKLQAQVDEARAVAEAIPNPHADWQRGQDRRFVLERLQWLEGMLADEQKAYNATYQVNDSAVVDVIARDTIRASEN